MIPDQVDFLPPDYRERKSRRRVWIVRGAMTVAVLCGMAGAMISTNRKASGLDLRLAVINRQREESRSRITQVEQLTRRKEDLSRRLGVLKDVLARARGALVFEAVGASCTDTTLLTNFNMRIDTASTRPEVVVTIEGRCPDHMDVANLQSRLGRDPLLNNVNVVLSEKAASGDSRIKFVMTARSPGLVTEELLRAVR
ncbi:MAG: hypothetical protein V2A76_11560 [Planctomycetota bacterium]